MSEVKTKEVTTQSTTTNANTDTATNANTGNGANAGANNKANTAPGANNATNNATNTDAKEGRFSPKLIWTNHKKKLFLVTILIALVLVSFYKWETTAGSDCLLAATKDRFLVVSAQQSGILRELKVKDGDWVDSAATLGVCEDLELEKQKIGLKSDLQQLSTKLLTLQSEKVEQQANVDQFQTYYNQRHREAEELRAEEAAITAAKEHAAPGINYPPELLELSAQIRAKQNDEQALLLDKQRQEYLFKNGLAAQFLVDLARSKHQIAIEDRQGAENRLMAARLQHSRKTRTAISEEAVAEKALRAATQKLQTLNSEMDLIRDQSSAKQTELSLMEKREGALTLKAPRAGLVLAKDIEKTLGKYLEKGNELCRIAEISQLQAVAEVSEWDIARVKVGSPVRFKIRSLNDRTFYGTVSHIGTEVVVKPETDLRVYNCEVVIDNKEKLLRPGMSGYARVSLGTDPVYQWGWSWVKRYIRFEYWIWGTEKEN